MLVSTPKLTKRHIDGLDRVWQIQREIEPLVSETNRWTGSIRRLALANAVRSSNSIEGFSASSSQVHEVLLGMPGNDLSQETQDALTGYRDAMTFVLQLNQDGAIQFDMNLIKALHFMLLKKSLDLRPGRFRSGPVYVRDENSGSVVHEGADFELVPKLVEEICDRLSNAEAQVNIIEGAMAHLNLVLIHPFKDGNGRMARILQSAVLARDSKISPVFISTEEYLAENTKDYYKVLSEVGGGRWNSKVDATKWIEFNLEAHWQQAHKVKANSKFLNALWAEIAHIVETGKFDERAVPALTHAALGNRLTNSSYREVLKDAGENVSYQSAGRDLVALTSEDLLIATGETKSRSYLSGPKLKEITLEVEVKMQASRPGKLFSI